jgi:hypothetical protein
LLLYLQFRQLGQCNRLPLDRLHQCNQWLLYLQLLQFRQLHPLRQWLPSRP